MPAGELDAAKHPRYRAVEHGLAIGQRERWIHGASEDEDSIDLFRQSSRARKPLFQAQQHCLADRRYREQCKPDGGYADHGLAAPATRQEEKQNPGEQAQQKEVAGLHHRPEELAEKEGQFSSQGKSAAAEATADL